MLGFHPLLKQELKKKGVRAFSTVLEVKRTHELNTVGDPSIVGNTERLWKLVLEVKPDDGPPFQAKVDAWFGQMSEPTVGDEYPVLFHPDDHTKLMIDDSAEGVGELVDAKTKERTDRVVAKMRARGQNEIADRYQAVFDAGLTTKWSNDPVELRKQIAERRTKIQATMAGTGPDAEQRLISDAMGSYASQYEALKQQFTVPGVPLAGQPAAPASQSAAPDDASATADALTKLADLRDRGALTDEEFQAQKKKLLGE
jgi:hypothetical protein